MHAYFHPLNTQTVTCKCQRFRFPAIQIYFQATSYIMKTFGQAAKTEQSEKKQLNGFKQIKMAEPEPPK